MKSYVIIQRICLLICMVCFGLPYILAGYWLVLLFFLALVAFWISRKKPVGWPTSIMLISFVLLAAAGMLANFSASLMVVAVTAGLAWWDLANFGQSIVVGQPPETTTLLEKAHLHSLAVAISSGLILAAASSYLNLQISFLGTVFLVLLAIGCLIYGIQTLAKNHV